MDTGKLIAWTVAFILHAIPIGGLAIAYEFSTEANKKTGASNRPMLTVFVVSLVLTIGFMIYGIVNITLSKDAQAGLGIIFVPIWAAGIAVVSFLVGYFIVRLKTKTQAKS